MDSNEPGSIRMKLYEVGWEQQRLTSADYWFFTHNFKKIGIERKTVDDLVASIGDKLNRQLENMLDHYDISMLLIEGNWRKATPSENLIIRRGIIHETWDSIWNYLERWQDKGVRVQITLDEGHTIHRLNSLFALYQKEYSLSGRTKEFADDRLLALPSGLRGETGIRLLQKFGSLKAIGNTHPTKFLEVEGVGTTRAESIWNHFNRGELVEVQEQLL